MKILAITFILLLLPALGMLLTNEVQWKICDFIVMGSLIFGFGSLFIFVSSKVSDNNRIFVAALFVVTFSLVWIELAVGIFTDTGS